MDGIYPFKRLYITKPSYPAGGVGIPILKIGSLGGEPNFSNME
jgi:hypothetical protein